MSERLSKGLPFKSDVTLSTKQTINAYQRLTFQIRLYTLQNRPERLIKGLPFKSDYTLSAKQTRKAYQKLTFQIRFYTLCKTDQKGLSKAFDTVR
jgi:hypothetical protein